MKEREEGKQRRWNVWEIQSTISISYLFLKEIVLLCHKYNHRTIAIDFDLGVVELCAAYKIKYNDLM